jgi:hypothetical protein
LGDDVHTTTVADLLHPLSLVTATHPNGRPR